MKFAEKRLLLMLAARSPQPAALTPTLSRERERESCIVLCPQAGEGWDEGLRALREWLPTRNDLDCATQKKDQRHSA